ncbi:hypothetical protein AB0L34_22490 [Micromonospora sp. NPDC052213]|uniref:hypothetical protein n=1 Tax=Micromonospora sp. NPDC052213 TaxID=3155812 RepID=UPI00344A21B4
MSNADTVTGVLDRITAHYVFPERSAEMATVVRRHLDDGRYDGLPGPQLCTTLTDDLQSVCPDRHLRLIWRERARPAWDRADDDAGEVAARRERYRLNAEGIHRVERLAGNVGLIEMHWEGTGVQPDQSCDAEHAWDIAYREALRHVLAATVDADSEHQVAVRVEAERALAELQLP